jgi:uncharacterized membrane protein
MSTGLKEKAKGVLKGNYWKAFVVSLVLLFAGANTRGGGSSGGREGFNRYRGEINERTLVVIGFIILIVAIIAIIAIAIRIFAGYMLEVGGRKFFIRAAEGETNMGYLGYAFSEGRYFNVLLTMLLRSVYTFLWSLLLIIPGIVKSYAYRMVPYILADNPQIGRRRAIELSNEMTNGEKWNMFVLDLSFLGWYLLGVIALGVGVLFVHPYEDATNAELYLVLRDSAIESGLTTYEELNLVDTLV